MALSRFMPYGAPELLEDQDARMAKATFAAIALLALAIGVAGTIAAFVPHERTIPGFDAIGHFVLPPIDPVAPLPRFAPPAAPPQPAAKPHALPTPVPDTQVLPAPTPAPTSSTPGATGTSGPAGPAVPGDPAPGPVGDAPPQPGEFVPVDVYPELLRAAPVVYPDLARDAGVEGRVVVLMLVGKDGHVMAAQVDPKHSVPMLDAAALESARSSLFHPAMTDGHPVMVWVARPFEFRLH